jgi:hypothetical protein
VTFCVPVEISHVDVVEPKVEPKEKPTRQPWLFMVVSGVPELKN